MRAVSFRKGTLVLEFPTHIVNVCKGVPGELEFRSHPRRRGEWAVLLAPIDRPDLAIAGHGTYHQDGPSIVVDGGRTDRVPDWWEEGRSETPEPSWVARMFGMSHRSVKIGRDKEE